MSTWRRVFTRCRVCETFCFAGSVESLAVSALQVETRVESSLALSLTEAAARAIEPATVSSLASLASVSADDVFITGYTPLGRRLAEQRRLETGALPRVAAHCRVRRCGIAEV